MIGYFVKRPHWEITSLLIALFSLVACALLLSPQTYMNLFLTYLLNAKAMLALSTMVLLMKIMTQRPYSREWALGQLRGGLPPILVVTVAFCVGMAAFTTMKLSIPRIIPFYLDPFLADASSWLHGDYLGAILHRVSPGWVAWPVLILYREVWFTLWFGIIAFVTLHEDRRVRLRYFWSMFASYVLIGNVLAAAMSSVGPIYYQRFYGDDRYAELISSLQETGVWSHLATFSDYLYENYLNVGSGFGTGISAMPSMHVAVVTLNAYLLSGISRTLGILAWLYVAIILFGSVYLGWHYVFDGYCSIAIVSLVWWASGRYRWAEV